MLSYCPAILQVGDWRKYLLSPEETDILKNIRTRNVNGLPLGDHGFLKALVERTGLKMEDLKPKLAGRPKKNVMCPGFSHIIKFLMEKIVSESLFSVIS